MVWKFICQAFDLLKKKFVLLQYSHGFHVLLVAFMHPMEHCPVEQDGSKCKCM